MAEEIMTDPAPVETQTDSAEVPEIAEAETELTGQQQEESPASDESTAADKSVESKETTKSDSEERATETAKRLSIENRTLKRQMREYQRHLQQFRNPQVQQPTVRAPVEPKLEDFYNAEDPENAYREAMKKFKDENARYAVEMDRRQRAIEQQQEEAKRRIMQFQETWNKRQKETLKRHADYNFQDAMADVDPDPNIAYMLETSDIGPDVLWHLRNNPEKADQLREMEPGKAVRALVELEKDIANQIKGIKTKPDSGKTVTTTVSGSNSGPSKPKSAADLLYGT